MPGLLLEKVASKRFEDKANDAYRVSTRYSLTDTYISTLLNGLPSVTSGAAITDADYERVSCDWIRNNSGVWNVWMNPTWDCPLGSTYDTNTNECKFPPEITCATGKYHVSKYACMQCNKGEFTSAPGLYRCFDCERAMYNDEAMSPKCKSCEDGATTWRLKATTKNACRCRLGYYAKNVVEAKPVYESVGCHVKLPTEPSLGYSPGPAGNLADCNAKCQLENLNKDLTGENSYDRFAVSPPLNTPGPDVNCICMRNITKALTTTVAPALCSTNCPLNPKEKCGWKKDADPQGEARFSVYKIYDLESKRTPCEPCPTVSAAIAEEKAAICYGGFYAPIAKPGYWSTPSNPTKFFECLVLGKGCIGGVRYGYGEYGEGTVVTRCDTGYVQDSTMCAACDSEYSQGTYLIGEGGRCVKCPHSRGGPPVLWYPLYLLMPFGMFMYWYPGLYWLISTIPVSFVAITFFQITGALAGFSVKWNKDAKLILKVINIINFDKTLFLFECSLPFMAKSYTFNFLLVVLLPFLYALKYYMEMRINQSSGDATATWNGFIKGTLYHVNLLFLPVMNQCLLLLNCRALGDGTFYLAISPATKCFEADHLASLLMMPNFIILVVIGWPFALCIFYWVGKKNNLLDEPSFAGTFGFVYQRYELQFFWWHLVVLAKKFVIIVCKVFLFNSFWQTPAAAVAIIGFLGIQAYCRPFEDANLDRVCTYGILAQCLFIIIGMLFNVERGQTDWHNTLTFYFFLVMIVISYVMFMSMWKDHLANSQKRKIMKFCKKHALKCHPKKMRINPILTWINSDPTASEIELFRGGIMANDAKYNLEPHLAEPYLMLIKDYGDILRWLTFPDDFVHRPSECESSSFGNIIMRVFEDENEDEDDDGVGVVTEDFFGTIKNYADFEKLKADLRSLFAPNVKKDTYGVEVTPELCKAANMPHLLYLTPARNQVLNVLMQVTQDERVNLIRAYRLLVFGERLRQDEEDMFGLPEMVKAEEKRAAQALEDAAQALEDENQVRIDALIPASTPPSREKDDSDVMSRPDGSDGLIAAPSKMTIDEYKELSKKLFARYDFDQSGTINSSDELQQLAFNLAFQLSQDPHNVATPDVAAIESVVEDCGQLDDSSAWDLNEFQLWFAYTVLENKLPGYYPPPRGK